MSTRLAPSLAQLRAEIDTRWPKRDRRSDGWIGDPSHSSRVSDHNPDRRGIVHALDVDDDGIDARWLVERCKRDPRVAYVIYDRAIFSRTWAFLRRAYTGSNPHISHVHVSILHDVKAETTISRWLADRLPTVDVSRLRAAVTARKGDPRPYPAGVRLVQSALRRERCLLLPVIPGRFGTTTQAAYARWQRRLGYSGADANGVPGPTTLARLGRGRFRVVA